MKLQRKPQQSGLEVPYSKDKNVGIRFRSGSLKSGVNVGKKIANFFKGKKLSSFDTEARGLDFLGGREIKKTRYMWVELSMYIFNYGTSIILSTALSKER